jgi:signal transduction histidine kinase
MKARRHSLRVRIVLTIIGSVVATSLIFGIAALGIAYTMEDRLFRDALAEEVGVQKLAWQRSGGLAAARNTDVRIYRAGALLPDDMVAEFNENPGQTEFFGRDGRHYHIQRVDLNEGLKDAAPEPAVAVMEVSDELLVRPYRESIIAFLAVVSLIVAAVMATLGWWIANRAMRPLTNLALSVETSGSAVPVVHANRFPDNEIGTLADALEQAFGRIAAFVERERSFTRDASHELRTPLAVIRGAAEVMRINQDLPPNLSDPLRRIETATTDMALALDQLLSLARECDGISKQPVRLRPHVDKAVSWAEIRYPSSRITVSLGMDEDAAAVVHPVSLQLVLNNLVGNCFQHVGVGHLIICFEGNCLTIADDGPGLPANAALSAPVGQPSSSSGSGLGLDISRRLCEAMGVAFIVGPRTSGTRGAQFRLQFPSA